MTDSAAGGTTRFRHYLTIVALIMAGEAVFFLPYLTVRLFRPTVLLVFEITNLELGIAFSLYGAVAMVSYALGGPLADRYAARTLMSVALAVTALGGLYMATIPSLQMLTLLYGFWGLTSILLFWAALLRATREWGGEANLGRAFGLLDGGRGLFAALMGVFGYALFSSLLPEDLSTATFEHRTEAVRQVILLLTSATFAVSLLVWFSLPSGIASSGGDSRSISPGGITRVLRMPAVWLQALIILCAYVSYKSLDDFALYAHQVMGFDEVRSAGVMSGVMWLRPVACIVAGLIADRTSTISMTLLCFFLVMAGSAALASGLVQLAPAVFFLVSMSSAAVGIYALRGLYFAIMGRARIPLAYTGTAVGIVSTIGYTPDIFMGPLMGYLLDSAPGAPGHFHFFWVLSGFSLFGLLATGVFAKITNR